MKEAVHVYVLHLVACKQYIYMKEAVHVHVRILLLVCVCSCSMNIHSLSCSTPDCNGATDTKQPAQDSLSPGSASSNPSLPLEGLVDGSSDACSSEVGTDQLEKGIGDSLSPLPTATQSSLDDPEVRCDTHHTSNIDVFAYLYIHVHVHVHIKKQSLSLLCCILRTDASEVAYASICKLLCKADCYVFHFSLLECQEHQSGML